jgi:hypothetical protein
LRNASKEAQQPGEAWAMTGRDDWSPMLGGELMRVPKTLAGMIPDIPAG